MMFDDSTLTDTVKTVPGLQGKTTYYWRASARNSAGSSAFSGSRQFQTALGTPVTCGSGKCGNGTTTARDCAMDESNWSHRLPPPGGDESIILFGHRRGSDRHRGLVVPDNRAPAHDHCTTGAWRRRMREGKDRSPRRGHSPPRHRLPQLVAPPNDAVDQPLTVKLVWRSIAAAIRYHVQVSTDAGFGGGIVLDDAAVNDTSKNLPGLNKSTRYYWRVSAIDAGGEGPFSSDVEFFHIPAASCTAISFGCVDGTARAHHTPLG